MKAVTCEQIRDLDRRAIEAGVSGRELMEQAGMAVSLATAHTFEKLERTRDEAWDRLVLVYKGNNGGDAMIAAKTWATRIALLCSPKEFKGDARWAYDKLSEVTAGHTQGIFIVRDMADLEEKGDLDKGGIVIDGLFGTGLKRPLGPPFDKVVRRVNASGARVVSVDVPSGLDADTGEPLGEAIRADVTVTMGLPKIGLLKEAAIDYVGKLVVAELPYPPELIEKIKTDVHLIHPNDVRPWLPKRKFSAHKGDFGHALLVAGSRGLTGAATLCATAAARAGAGLTTLCSPKDVYPLVAVASPPEVMVRAIEETDFTEFAQRANVLACGCGLGRSPKSKRLVENLIRSWPHPLLLDADALNHIAANPKILLAAKAPILITPHPGEMARLIGKTSDFVQANRWDVARRFARDYQVIVVLKGARTVVTDGGELWINATGNPAMASGGMGDALTGIIAGLLAQGLKPFDAARVGVHLHGLAADLAQEKSSGRALLASDLISHLNAAIASLR